MKSTGPRTDKGKASSRKNTLKHGLAGKELLLDADADEARRRIEEWRPNYTLENEEDLALFESMVVASVQVERCQAQQEALRLEEAARAAESWDDDRRDEVNALAAGLARRPEAIARQLETTKQGAEWLIAQWTTLGNLLKHEWDWTPEELDRAHDLLGTPRELRARLPLGNPAERLALVEHQVDRLRGRKARGLDAQDERARLAVVSGLPLVPSKAMRTLQRYEAACQRRHQWATDLLRPRRVAAPTPSQCEPGQDAGAAAAPGGGCSRSGPCRPSPLGPIVQVLYPGKVEPRVPMRHGWPASAWLKIDERVVRAPDSWNSILSDPD